MGDDGFQYLAKILLQFIGNHLSVRTSLISIPLKFQPKLFQFIF